MKLYGKNPVSERLKTNPKTINKIYLQEGYKDTSYICKKARQWKIPILIIPRSKMAKIGRSHNTQGIVADIEGFNYIPYETLLADAVKRRHTIVFLDNLNDPQNLGAIIRSLACLSGFSVVLPTHDSVGVTEAVLRVASGGDNYVTISQVPNLAKAIVAAKQAGFWIAGAVVDGGDDLTSTTLPFPLSLVVGSEQKGIREGVRKHLDLKLTMPMKHVKLSFNVAQATTIFCYEILRQKQIISGDTKR